MLSKIGSKIQLPRYALAVKGPVVVSADANNWETYGHGIFDGCGRNAAVNHAVLAVGYGKSVEGTYAGLYIDSYKPWFKFQSSDRPSRFDSSILQSIDREKPGWQLVKHQRADAWNG